MRSLEHAMIFIPSRYFARGRRIFVAFDLSSLQADQRISSLELHLPAAGVRSKPASKAAVMRMIASAWSDHSIRAGVIPERRKERLAIAFRPDPADALTVTADITSLAQGWRLPQTENHGIYIKHPCLLFSGKKPAYVIADLSG